MNRVSAMEGAVDLTNQRQYRIEGHCIECSAFVTMIERSTESEAKQKPLLCDECEEEWDDMTRYPL